MDLFCGSYYLLVVPRGSFMKDSCFTLHIFISGQSCGCMHLYYVAFLNCVLPAQTGGFWKLLKGDGRHPPGNWSIPCRLPESAKKLTVSARYDPLVPGLLYMLFIIFFNGEPSFTIPGDVLNSINQSIYFPVDVNVCMYIDAVGWAAGRASGL